MNLKEWLDGDMGNNKRSKSGRYSSLARHLGVSQPAISRMVKTGSYQNLKYAKKIMEFTGLSASELFPDWVELFEYSKVVKQKMVESKKKELLSNIESLKKELKEIGD